MINRSLEAAARTRPSHPAIRELGKKEFIDFESLRDAVARSAGAWRQAGVRPGERVPVAVDRRASDLIQLLGLFWLGAIPVLGGESDSRSATDEESQAIEPHSWSGDSPQVEIYTSGSTGSPKSILLKAGQIKASVEASAAHLGTRDDDAWLCALPLRHVGGLSIVFRCLEAGSTLVLAPGSFDAGAIAEACQDGTVTQISLVPTQLLKMLPFLGSASVSPKLRFILLGGAACPESLKRDCEKLALPVALTWGMTECASQVATALPGDLDGPLRPLPGVSVSRDESTGRLRVDGAIAPEGSFLTRDLGQLESGAVVLQGRIDDLVISGGENLSLSRIADALLAHPEVLDAAVLSRPDETWGERPYAVLVSASETPPAEDQLREFLVLRGFREREIPDGIQWLESLPRNEMGKLLRSRISFK